MSEKSVDLKFGAKDLADLTSEDRSKFNTSPGFEAKMREQERKWQEFVDSASDEEIVRAYLQARVGVWQQLPYDWMDMGSEALDSWNIIDYPPEVEAAYDRSRADPQQRAKFEKDYDRGQDATDEWLHWLEQTHGLRR